MSKFGTWLCNLFSRRKKEPITPAERVRQAAESILGNEGLTDNLDDKAAQALLGWGVACAERIARSTAGMDDETAKAAMDPRMQALRRMLRAVNRWFPRRLEAGFEENRAALDAVIEYAARVYGPEITLPDEEQLRAFLHNDLASDPAQAITGLRALFEKSGGVQ